jgi:hypothetical protein
MQMEITMKTITSLLTAVLLVSGAASAMADQQRSDEAPGYALSWQATQGSGAAYASARHAHRGPYASASHERNVRTRSALPVGGDFGSDPAVIDFQEQGSH